VKAGWKTKSLGEILLKTETVNPAATPDDDFEYIDVSSVSNETYEIEETQQLKGKDAPSRARRLVKAGDVIFATIRPTLQRIARVPASLDGQVCSTGYFVMRPYPELDAQYLFYSLFTQQFMSGMESLQKGASYPAVTDAEVRSQQISYPTLQEQHRIVTLLDEAFADIATAKANAEKNLQNAREFFLNHLSEALQATGPDWVEATVGETCTLRSGTTVPTSIERPVGEIPYVKVAEMSMPENIEGICTSIRFLDRNDVKSGWLIPAGAVIFPKRGGAILTNKKRLTLVEMCADLNIMSVIPSDVLTPEFLYLYFLNVDMRKLGTGSSIPQINNYDIAPLKISFPKSKNKQVELTEKIRAIEAECQSLSVIYHQKLTALDDLKKSLLQQAFTGQL
jgi:type I restriction enzyme S subunit